MRQTRRFTHQIVLATIIMLFFAHTIQVGSQTTETPTPSTENTPTPIQHTAPTAIASEEMTEWSYVVIGDSATWGYPQVYAELVEETLGIEIKISNRSTGGMTSTELLRRFEESESFQEAIADADLITIQIPLGAFTTPSTTYAMGRDCGGDDNEDCLREALDQIQTDTEEIFAALVELSDPSETIIRTHGTWIFDAGALPDPSIHNIYFKYWEAANTAVVDEAARYGIPVAPVWEAFMGEDSTEIPREKGLLSDFTHTTPEGAELIADLLHELGYAYTPADFSYDP